jgi:tetratricopeptide (TPR) repeat protein
MNGTDEGRAWGAHGVFFFPIAVMALWVGAGFNLSGQSAAPERAHSLGKVDFPTTCDPRVQNRIEEGVALLHSFQYREAEVAFTEVAKQDPHCAMAYWGKAMSLYQQLWGWPNARAFADGREDVETAKAQKSAAPRELAYIDLAVLFFERQSTLSISARMRAFSEAWEKVYREFPKDINAGAFYGLSLVALSGEGIDEESNRRKAIAVLDPLFHAAPENPGPAHYLIHAADTPELAPLALDAARQYARIAPDSAHALHMPSHIFVRMGLWRESIESNLASAEAAVAAARRAGRADIQYQVHAMDFLDYSYLQAGDEAGARQMTGDLENVVGASAEQIANYQADFRARAALELHRWSDAESLISGDEPLSRENTYWVRALGAAHNRHIGAAQLDLAKLEELVAGQREGNAIPSDSMPMPGGSSNDDGGTHVLEAQAWIAFAQGNVDDAIRTLRVAAANEKVRSLSMPASEMLADMLLECGRAPLALHEYELALREAPNRFDALYGAARAAESAGDPVDARKYFTKLVTASIPSADRFEFREAREFLALK